MEDSRVEDIELSIYAFERLVAKTLNWMEVRGSAAT
jgi:hypothetical protein